MRRVLRVALPLWLALMAFAAAAADFRLADGTVIVGELVAPNDNGVIIRRAAGGLTERIPWERFAVETLRELNASPALREFVEVHLALADPEVGAARAAREVPQIKPVPGRLERPARRPTLAQALTGTPIGWFLLLVLYAANFYAAYEIARFRNYPPLVVMAVAVVPVIGPLIFLCLPTHVGELAPVAGEFAVPEEVVNEGAQKLAEAGLSGSGLAIGTRPAAPVAVAGASPVFKKADTEFNRRFFESQFPGFFRLVRGEADKHLLLYVKAGRNEYLGTRITRISSNELGLQLQIGREVMIRFADVTEVQARPKE